jgi:hypothetical protein
MGRTAGHDVRSQATPDSPVRRSSFLVIWVSGAVRIDGSSAAPYQIRGPVLAIKINIGRTDTMAADLNPQQPPAATEPAGANSSSSSIPQSLTSKADRILKAICDCPGRSSDQIAASLGYSLGDVRFIVIAILGGRVWQDAHCNWWPASSAPSSGSASKVIARTFLPGYEPPFLKSSASGVAATSPPADQTKQVAPRKNSTRTPGPVAASSLCRKECEICGNPAIRGERFCKVCRKSKLAELEEAGYLRAVPQGGKYWRSEQRENTCETKHGRDG